MQKLFPLVLSKRVHAVSLGMRSKSSQRKPAKHKKHHVMNFQNDFRWHSLKKFTWKQSRDVLASVKGLQVIKVITPPVINHLS